MLVDTGQIPVLNNWLGMVDFVRVEDGLMDVDVIVVVLDLVDVDGVLVCVRVVLDAVDVVDEEE